MSALDDVLLHRVDTAEDAANFMRWLGERRPVLAVDTETTGLDPMRDHIRLVQFGDAYQGWTLGWDLWRGLALEAFSKYEGEYVFHNAKFDLRFLRRAGVDLPLHRCHDTMIMSQVLEATRLHGLKPLSTHLIDPKAGIAQAMLDKAMTDGKWDWATIPYEVPIYSVYAAMDTVLTARLYTELLPQVKLDAPNAYDLELAFLWCVLRMEEKGARVDLDYAAARQAEFDAYVDQADAWGKEHFGINKLGSNPPIIQRLQEDGIEFYKHTCGCLKGDSREDCEKPGSHLKTLALDKEVLEYIITRHEHPLAEVVLQRRRAQKLSSTYLSNFQKMAHHDGRLRPSMKTMGAATGRMSMELMQTLPRRSSKNQLAIIARNCILPSEDSVLVMCDFDQIEARAMAHVTGDRGLIAAFSGGDFFCNMASEIYGQPITKEDERRQKTKNATYAKMYGAGPAKFGITAGITEDEARQFMAQLDQTYPGFRELTASTEREAMHHKAVEGKPFVRSPLTNRRYFPKYEEKAYVLVNYRIQGMAAEILKMKTVELDAAGLGDYLTLLVHDEVIADIPKADLADAVATMNSVMNDSQLLSVPITAGTDLGRRWGEKGAISLEEATS